MATARPDDERKGPPHLAAGTGPDLNLTLQKRNKRGPRPKLHSSRRYPIELATRIEADPHAPVSVRIQALQALWRLRQGWVVTAGDGIELRHAHARLLEETQATERFGLC
jgi:hypothetical protein